MYIQGVMIYKLDVLPLDIKMKMYFFKLNQKHENRVQDAS